MQNILHVNLNILIFLLNACAYNFFLTVPTKMLIIEILLIHGIIIVVTFNGLFCFNLRVLLKVHIYQYTVCIHSS